MIRLSHEGEPKTNGEAVRHEGRADSLAALTALVRAELVGGAEDELKNGRLDRIVVRDRNGTEYVHDIPRDEADTIDRALWSAGENMELDNLVGSIVAGIRRAGLDTINPDHLDLTVRLVETEEAS